MSQSPESPLLETKGLTRHFRLPSHFLQRDKPVLHALNAVDIRIRKGEAFCVVGESGCGKTTLGRAVMGLTPPSAGEVMFGGDRIDHLGARARAPYRRRMQMVFQNPYASLNPRHRVYEAVTEPLRTLSPNLPRSAVSDQFGAVMRAVGADPDWGGRLPHEFSGGQRQRISIARALIAEPEFIVADEPISALDVSIQAQVLNLLTETGAARGLTYLFITHDLSVVEHFGDRVAVMYLGRVVEQAPTQRIFAAPRHPYTRLLLDSAPRLEGGAFARDRTPGEPPNPVNPPPGCAFAPRCPLANDRCKRETPVLAGQSDGASVACHAVEEGRG